MNCVVIIEERTSIPYCIIKSKRILSDEILKNYAKQWMDEHNENCSWSNYRYIVMNINDAPKLKNVYIIQFMIELIGKYTTAKIFVETIEEGVYSQI